MEKELKWARKYVNQYKWSIIPVVNKVPKLESWNEYRKRLPTDQELIKWFENTQNGIAIVTGKLSNIVVIDVDTLQHLKEPIFSPINVQTPKGKHWYFKYQEEIKNAVRIEENIDIRSEGGFCCAPPTIGYKWINDYFSINKLCKLPDRFIIKQEPKNTRKEPNWIAEALEGMKIGNIDNTLVSVLGRLRRDGYSRSDARILLEPHANAAGATEGHLEDKIEHVWSTYENKKVITNGISLSVNSFLSRESKVEWLVPGIFAKQSLCFMVGLPECGKTWAAMDLAIELSRGGYWLGHIKTNKAKVLFIDQERALPETQRRFKALLSEKDLTKEEIGDTLYIDVSSHRKMDLDNSYQSFRNELMEIKPDVIIVDSFVTFHTKDENSRMEVQKVLDRIKSLREEFGIATIFVNHESKMAYQDAQDNQEPTAGRMVGSIGVIAAADSILSIKKVNESTSAVYHTKNSLANQVEAFMFSIADTPKGIKIETSK